MGADRYELEVHCEPVGMPRARSRVVRVGGKHVAATYYPSSPGRTEKSRKEFERFERARRFKAAVRDSLLARTGGWKLEPWTGPVRVDIEAYFERPQRLLTRRSPDGRIPHTSKPDRDNVDKCVLDALQNAGLFRDDAQVCAGSTSKWWVAKGCAPGVRIVAERIRSEDGGLCE